MMMILMMKMMSLDFENPLLLDMKKYDSSRDEGEIQKVSNSVILKRECDYEYS